MKQRSRISLLFSGNRRLAALLLAALFLAATYFDPRFPLQRNLYRYLFVLDITQSMNAKDSAGAGLPPDRLGAAKAAVRRVLHDLPCGSEAGLGLYTTQNVQILFEPLEVCGHLPVIEDVLDHVDWRMAWAANSHVAQGLYAAVHRIEERDPGLRLAFFTDGQETPPLAMKPMFDGKPGAVRGAIIGVGGTRPTVVPRYDRENRFIGQWENFDIEPPPVSTTDYSEKVEAPILPREGPYLSWLDEAHLKELSAVTGLAYRRLEDPEGVSELLRRADFAEHRAAETDLRPFLALAALALMLGAQATERHGSNPLRPPCPPEKSGSSRASGAEFHSASANPPGPGKAP